MSEGRIALRIVCAAVVVALGCGLVLQAGISARLGSALGMLLRVCGHLMMTSQHRLNIGFGIFELAILQ